MSLNNQIVAKPRGQVALLEEAQRIMDVVDVMGKKIGKLAVYDQDKFIDLAELVAANKQNPGMFGEVLMSIKVTDSSGRLRAVVREGRVKQGILEWTKRGDLMRGWKRSDMAAFFDIAPTDTRLNGIINAIKELCREHLKIAVGSDKGYLRVLTQQGMERRQNFRGEMLVAIAENGDKDNQVFRSQGMLSDSEATAQLTLFAAVADDERELS